MSADTPCWPGDAPTVIEPTAHIGEGSSCNLSRLSFSSHAGTHVDAPFHFLPDGKTLERIPLEAMIGPCWVADMTGLKSVDAAALEAAGIPNDTQRLLVKTDNSRLWAEGRREFTEDYVCITPDAAEWVVRRGIRLIGTDYLSIERYGSADHAVHRTLLGNEIVVLEGVNLYGIAPGRYRLICLPLLVPGCDGAPARVVLVEE